MCASLVVVGSGIKFISHLTVEAKAHIEKADTVLYLVNEPLTKKWIESIHPHAESLDYLYSQFPLRLHNYQAITDYILKVVKQQKQVCVVFYGHPTVFSKPALDAVIQAKQLGIHACVLPGISAEDCLFADLLINPGSCGCLSFEATDLLIHRRKIDPTSHVIIWQVDVVGCLGLSKAHGYRKENLSLLVSYLTQYYSSDHKATLYVAAQYPGFDPYIEHIEIARLPEMDIPSLSTLYIPPTHEAHYDEAMLVSLRLHPTT